ncbi:hypothetical protein GCM10010317_077530 [Streptomyces mirabilis]|uniref:hypothetical protein n=1 Tax=Streptomyces mirabilis TaxID=68239 RepID=UPI00167E24A4|nr:hypothetical protein [Streptomyces mirabilis]GHD70359.1 hypothetical protein GCM10010317_077530 [Streptomyces mirabilis]
MSTAADELQAAAYKARTWNALPANLRQPLAEWLETTYISLAATAHPDWHPVVAPDALAVARAINGAQP